MQAIANAAAEWKARHDEGLTAEEQTAFFRWMEENPRHAEFFCEMDATWALLDRLREFPPTDVGIELKSGLRYSDRRRRAAAWGGGLLAAAAALAVMFAGFRRTNNDAEAFNETVAVETGLVQRLDLPDGSIVRLNGDTEVSIEFEAGLRRVQLVRGQAHFSVAKVVHRPFVVTAAGVDVRAVGTAFDVALRSAGVEVLVTEGQVHVADRANGASLLPAPAGAVAERDRLLVAGEQAIIPLSTASSLATVRELTAERVGELLSWHNRRLEFDSATVAEIAAEFNRCNRQQLVIADANLAQQRFSGSFQSDEPETFLALLKTRMEISVTQGPRETVVRARSTHSRP